MFILSNINISEDLVQVYDTSDGTNDTVRLSLLASQIRAKKLKIHGVGLLSDMKRSDGIPLAPYGIYISYNEAKEQLAQIYIKEGLSKEEAYLRVGLPT